jgi:tRNA 2-selenouridine synthase SelU
MGSEDVLCESRKNGGEKTKKTIELSWDNNTMGYCDI